LQSWKNRSKITIRLHSRGERHLGP
jgi:hypothetical protein